MGYYNIDNDHTPTQTETADSKPNQSDMSDMDKVREKINVIRTKGNNNNLFEQNKLSAKIGLVCAGIGFLYSWRTRKPLLLWTVGAGVGGLIVGNIIKRSIKTENKEIDKPKKTEKNDESK
jgi:hypothetical protein